MILYILRGAFLLLVASVSMLYILKNQLSGGLGLAQVVLLVTITMTTAVLIIAVDIALRQKKLASLSGVFLGLLAGLVVAYALGFVVDLVGELFKPDPRMAETVIIAQQNLLRGVKVLIGLATCYVGISLVIQTKNDFRFVIPYVEFSRQVRGPRAVILDSSVIIDGRICDLVDTRIMQSLVIVPKFVLNELQLIADSSDRLRRARGRRGLDTVAKLQEKPELQIVIDETEVEGATVDQKLVTLATHLQAQVMTNDFNLNKIATLRGVEVVNLNDVAKTLRPVALPGEKMAIKIVKPGEASHQGVGYLDDGTMVVVENARRLMQQEIDVTVTSTLQTSAGRMIFARFDGDSPSHASRRLRAASDDESDGDREDERAHDDHGDRNDSDSSAQDTQPDQA